MDSARLPKLSYQGHAVDCRPGETVLDALLRQGVEVAYSCKKGSCLTCLLQASSEEIPDTAQAGLRATLKARGCFLACQFHPTSDLSIFPLEDAVSFGRATLCSVEQLTASIARVGLEAANPIFYHSGQFINLRRADGTTRSYSLASVPRLDEFLEIHVHAHRNGRMSSWLLDEAKPGDQLDIQGPHGDCYYLPGHRDRPLLLLATGTGLAPLWGIARDALHDGHEGKIFLYHGSGSVDGLYLQKELLALAERYPNFHYIPCCSQQMPPPLEAAHAPMPGRADDIAFATHSDLTGWGVYICGNPDMVRSAKRNAYLAGARLADIHADPFDLRDLRLSPR